MKLRNENAESSVKNHRYARDFESRIGLPKPREERRGLKVTRWPPEHLATLKACHYLVGEGTPSEILEYLQKHRVDILDSYEQRNGRPINVNVIANRIDKGERYKEERNYRALVSPAMERMKNDLEKDIT